MVWVNLLISQVLMGLNQFILISTRKTARIMNILSLLVNQFKHLCRVEENLGKEHLEWIALVVGMLEGKKKKKKRNHKEEEARRFKMKWKKKIKISYAFLETKKVNIIIGIIKRIMKFMLKMALLKQLQWTNHTNHHYHQGKQIQIIHFITSFPSLLSFLNNSCFSFINRQPH